MRKGFSSNCLGYEGSGSVPPVMPIVEGLKTTPFGKAKTGVVSVIETWLSATQDVRFSEPALYTLKEGLCQYSKKQVQSALRESFHGTVLREIRDAMEACGLLPPAEETANKSRDLNESILDVTVDTAEDLLREAVIHVPNCDARLRDRIEVFLSRGKN